MKPTLLSLMVMLHLSAFTQDDSTQFEIKNYKYRTPGFTAWALYPGVSGHSSESSGSSFTKYNNLNISMASSSFYRIRSTASVLSEIAIIINPGFSTFKNTTNQEEIKGTRTFGSVNFNMASQHFNRKNWFLEWGNNIHADGDFSRAKENGAAFRNDLINLDGKAYAGIGKGRVEWVQDAQQALFMLKDLKDQGLIEDYSGDDALELAQLITWINNRRVFDFRRRRIFELEKLDSFFKSKNPETELSMRYFATINDNWVFAFNPFRKSGIQWFFRVKFEADIHNRNYRLKTPEAFIQKDEMLAVGPEAGLWLYKPVSLHWQLNFGLQASRTVGDHKWAITAVPGLPDLYKQQGRKQLSQAMLHTSAQFIPNTRTLLSAILEYTVENENNVATQYRTMGRIHANYFIGYRTTLFFDVSFHSNTLKYKSPITDFHNSNAGFFIGILHYLM